jgi:DNA-binding PucR family transcriptional regulator
MTLAVYLRENQSRTRTAEVLQIHPNTVSYRVRQAEELLQRTFERDTVDLQVALAVLPALGRLEHNRPDEQ